MKIIETFLRAKSGVEALCEDAIVVTPDFLAVLDGATDKTGRRYGSVFGGRFAAEQLSQAISALRADIAATDAIDSLTDALDSLVRASDTDPREEDGPSAVAAIYSRQRREIWRVGDVSIRIGPRARYGHKKLDQVAAGTRSAFLQSLVFEGEAPERLDVDPGRELILPMLEQQHRFRNLDDRRSAWAFGALDGRPVPRRFIQIFEVPRHSEVTFASDGYPRVARTLSESERYLEAEIRRDPLRIWKHPATKGVRGGHESFDDRAWLRFVT
jgi:hypothetical protein